MTDLTGQRFGRLIVIKYVEKYKYLCQCDCGKRKIILSKNLKNGHTKSCGCLAETNALKHGHNRKEKVTETYCAWAHMKQRCNNPNNKNYHYYGGRGIKVCKRWMKFSNFLEDMGEKPKGLTLERIKNDKGYYKENCISR